MFIMVPPQLCRAGTVMIQRTQRRNGTRTCFDERGWLVDVLKQVQEQKPW